MAWSNIGYSGTVTDVEWAKLIPFAGGSDYAVPDEDSFRASIGAGTREVALTPGAAAGQGVLAANDAASTVSLGSVGSGSRWDLIVLRRNWGTSTSSIVAIAGSAARALPVRNTQPGVLDDQPLWLARVAAGQTAVQELVDLRAFVGNGGAWAADDLVRSYIDRVGTVITIDKTRWERRMALGAPVWVRAGTGVGNYVPPQTTRITYIEGDGPHLSSTSDAQIAKLAVTLTEAGLVNIAARLWWNSDGFNSAGTFRLKYGAVNGTEVDRFRAHNNGSGGEIPVHVSLFATIALPAGTTNIYLTGQRESAGDNIDVGDFMVSAWATS
jgi:hypothetical protein